ncbi:MAG TPA: M50 family metallopeptidase [Pseudonocardiaceae bacterium]|nr:M50 family metallopeptidase [Pseudonocardiaceae bacterium]
MNARSVGEVWQQVVSVQPGPPAAVTLAAAAVALLAVLLRDVWVVARNVVTIAHEGGHALVALLVGRRLTGIRLHSDTSGVTLSRGHPRGPGMVATTMAGYLAPPLLGLGCAALLASGHITALLWLTVVVLVAMLAVVRNAYGIVSILFTAAVVFVVSWFTSAQVQAGFAYAFTWFVMLAGVRTVLELQRARGRGRAPKSDADQLAGLTRVPGVVWVVLFGVVGVVVLLLGVRWLGPFAALTSSSARPLG